MRRIKENVLEILPVAKPVGRDLTTINNFPRNFIKWIFTGEHDLSIDPTAQK